jgi:excisionase family DNA binding protein
MSRYSRINLDVAPLTLTTAETAFAMGVSPQTIRSWAHSGKIKPIDPDRKWRFSKAAIKKYIEGERK